VMVNDATVTTNTNTLVGTVNSNVVSVADITADGLLATVSGTVNSNVVSVADITADGYLSILAGAVSANVVMVNDATLDAAIYDNALTVISFPHKKIHEGALFVASDSSGDLDSALPLRYSITTGASSDAHFEFTMGTSAGCTVQLYENVTITDAGEALTYYDMNRVTANSSTVTAARYVTFTGGTLLWSFQTGTDNPATNFGGETANRHEFMLKNSEDYAIVVTALAESEVVNTNLYHYED